MTGAILRSAAGFVLLSLPGLAALRGAPWSRSMTRVGHLALAIVLGLAIAVPTAAAAGLAGIPLHGPEIAGIVLFLAAGIRLARIRNVAGDRTERHVPSRRSPGTIASRLLLAGAGALFLAKLAVVPVWSWDYYAVHGTRARRIFAENALDLAALKLPGLDLLHPDYPLGVPLAWRILSLGTPPDARSVKIIHVLLALALLALAREGVLTSGRSETAANTAAAFVAISPLLWDTESLGLVELPFALFLGASFLVFLKLANSRPPGGEWVWGAIAGFLPWIKFREGLTLAVFLTIVTFLFIRPKRKFGGAAAAIFWAGAAAAVSIFLLPPGEHFLAGDWPARGLARLAHPGAIAISLGRDLAAPEWFGFWIVFAAGWIFSIVRKRRAAALLSSVVAAQLAAYASVYFVTYLDPAEHIRASFFRITAALLPAALIALMARAAADSSEKAELSFSAGRSLNLSAARLP